MLQNLNITSFDITLRYLVITWLQPLIQNWFMDLNYRRYNGEVWLTSTFLAGIQCFYVLVKLGVLVSTFPHHYFFLSSLLILLGSVRTCKVLILLFTFAVLMDGKNTVLYHSKALTYFSVTFLVKNLPRYLKTLSAIDAI